MRTREKERYVSYHTMKSVMATSTLPLRKVAEPVQRITIVPRNHAGALGCVMQTTGGKKSSLNTKAELEASTGDSPCRTCSRGTGGLTQLQPGASNDIEQEN